MATSNQVREIKRQLPFSLANQEMERTRSLIDAALENVRVAADLVEASRELRYDNADLRDFLREKRLIALSWLEWRKGLG